MWTGGREDTHSATCGGSACCVNPVLRVVKKTVPLEVRLEKRLNEYLRRFHGTFCMDAAVWRDGDITRDMFRRYLKACVDSKVLTEKQDQSGRIWYSGNGKNLPSARTEGRQGSCGTGRDSRR